MVKNVSGEVHALEQIFSSWNNAEKTIFIMLLINISYSIYFCAHRFVTEFTDLYTWGELFISYHGGLVRRGVIGSILSLFAGKEYFVPGVAAIFVLIYIIWYFFVAKTLFKVFERAWTILLLGAPGIFMAACYEVDTFARKDIFIVAGLSILLLLIYKAIKNTWKLKYLLCLFVLIYIPVFLIHELSFFFIGFPLLLLLGIYKTRKERIAILFCFAILVAGSLWFGFTFSGTPEQREQIIQFWQQFYPPIQESRALHFIGQGLTDRPANTYMLGYLKIYSLRVSIIKAWLFTFVLLGYVWFRYNINKACIALLGKFFTCMFYAQGIMSIVAVCAIMNDCGRIVSLFGIMTVFSGITILLTYKNKHGELPQKRGYELYLSNHLCFAAAIVYLFGWRTLHSVPLSARSFFDLQFWQERLLLGM